MQLLRCVFAEWALVSPRLTRTRLGISLLGLGAALVWLSSRGFDPFTATLLAGALGAIVAAAGVAGSGSDRGALTTALTHPTTPLAVAAGRWFALVAPAMVLVVACAMATEWHAGRVLAGFVAAAAVGSCALALVIPLGSAAATALFLFITVAGAVAPERLVALARPGVVRLAAASVLELGPALWHYRDIATGDRGAIVHGLAWTGLGILLASAGVARLRGAPHQ